MDKRQLYIEKKLEQAKKDGVVCVCKQVSERKLRKTIKEGKRRFTTLKFVTGASSGCGMCQPIVEDIIEDEIKKSR